MKNIRIPFIALITSVWLLGFIPNAWAESDADKGYVQLLNDVFKTELVYPQGKGEVQILLEGEYSKGAHAKGYHFPLVIEYGITDSWQVGVDWVTFQTHNPDDDHTEKGIGDFGLTTKYAFMNMGGSDVHASLNFEVIFPIADFEKHLTNGYTVYAPSVSLAKDFTDNNSQVFTQIGVEFVDRTEGDFTDPAAHHEFFWSAGFFVPVVKNEQLLLSGEVTWVSDEITTKGHENHVFLTPGLIYVFPGHHWEMAIGVPIGLNEETDDYGIVLALTYEFQT